MTATPYGQGDRMLTLSELCAWLNITERHARKLVERGAVPYRKIGHLLRFPETEVEEWSQPKAKHAIAPTAHEQSSISATTRASRRRLPKSLIE
jgi:excisionase family DNA binding protein